MAENYENEGKPIYEETENEEDMNEKSNPSYQHPLQAFFSSKPYGRDLGTITDNLHFRDGESKMDSSEQVSHSFIQTVLKFLFIIVLGYLVIRFLLGAWISLFFILFVSAFLLALFVKGE